MHVETKRKSARGKDTTRISSHNTESIVPQDDRDKFCQGEGQKSFYNKAEKKKFDANISITI